MTEFTEPDFNIQRARQAARDDNGGVLPRRVSRAVYVKMKSDAEGTYINSRGKPNAHMAPGDIPRRPRVDGTFPAGPGRPKGSRRSDLSGEVFRHLTVLTRVEDAKGAKAQYACRCDCGVEVVVRGDNLKSGNTVSCGHVASGKPYTVTGRPEPTRTALSEEEWEAHRTRAEEGRRMSQQREAEAKARRDEQVRVARNARRRERRRKEAEARWAQLGEVDGPLDAV